MPCPGKNPSERSLIEFAIRMWERTKALFRRKGWASAAATRPPSKLVPAVDALANDSSDDIASVKIELPTVDVAWQSGVGDRPSPVEAKQQQGWFAAKAQVCPPALSFVGPAPLTKASQALKTRPWWIALTVLFCLLTIGLGACGRRALARASYAM